ncbi:MAG: hypothetical protein WD115_01950 [Balneolaceae bacterium]
MSNEEPLESYRIGSISVEIHTTENPKRLQVLCNDGTFQSGFTVSEYEYTFYKRHMNQKILHAYKRGHDEENGESDTTP